MTEEQLIINLKFQHGNIGWVEQMILLAIDGYRTPALLLTDDEQQAACIAYDWLYRVTRLGIEAEKNNHGS